MPWFVYIVSGCDGKLYAGVTTDPDRRMHEHNHTARGARWCRARRPVKLRWLEQQPDRSAAQRREAALKRLSRQQKLELIASAES